MRITVKTWNNILKKTHQYIEDIKKQHPKLASECHAITDTLYNERSKRQEDEWMVLHTSIKGNCKGVAYHLPTGELRYVVEEPHAWRIYRADDPKEWENLQGAKSSQLMRALLHQEFVAA